MKTSKIDELQERITFGMHTRKFASCLETEDLCEDNNFATGIHQIVTSKVHQQLYGLNYSRRSVWLVRENVGKQ